jgi:class 3 adenylate cyclase/tetratricopeptide (TPR) repeat protein
MEVYVDDLRQWLAARGLERYADALQAHDIDLDIARSLTDADLEASGLPIGARKRLLKAFANIDAEPAVVTNSGANENSPYHVEAERRQLAVLFSDVVGSTTLAEKLDAEDLRTVLLEFQKICAEIVQRYGGQIGLFIGDGLTAYFGYPRASEDFAERAVSAGLQIIQDISGIQPTPIQVRCGIHVGPVVVGDMGAGDKRIRDGLVGEVPNIAARLQSIAGPGSVVISDATQQIVGGSFDSESLGDQALKGVSLPIKAYRVIAPRMIASRFEGRRRHSLTRFVGRRTELAFLQKRWDDAKEGDGQSVLLVGEAGIGKSRLLERMRDHVRSERGREIALFCSPLHQTSALWPVSQFLRRTLALDQQAETSRAKITTWVRGLQLDNPDEADRELAALMLGHAEGDTDPTASRQILFSALSEAFWATVADSPTLLVLEDAHWIDPSTSELIGRLLLLLRERRALILITARPEFHPNWQGAQIVTLPLTRLSRRETEEMVRCVAPPNVSPAILSRLAARAEGVPLFIEELTKSVIDRNNNLAAAGDIELPPSLQAALHTRLDRLAPIRQIVQIAALLGRVFQQDLLVAISQRSEADVRKALKELVAAELIFPLPGRDTASYEFKHALVQEAATSTMLRNQKAQLHRQIADSLVSLRSGVITRNPELLADHLMEAGNFAAALDQWEKAGALAQSRAAAREALSHYRKALECADRCECVSRGQDRIARLYIALANVLMQAEGYRAIGLDTLLQSAEKSATASGSKELEFKSAILSCPYFYATGRNEEYLVRCDRQLAKLSPEVIHYRGGLLITKGLAHFNRGEFQSAIESLHAAVEIVDQLGDEASPLIGPIGGASPGICLRQYITRAMFLTGDFDPKLIEAALQWMLDRDLNPFDRAWALIATGYTRFLFGEYLELSEVGNELIQIGDKYGYAPRKGNGLIFRGISRAMSGQLDQGIEDLKQGYRIWRGQGVVFHTPERACPLCDALISAGRSDEAEQVLNEIDALVAGTDERSFQAECIRLRGMIAQGRNQIDQAEALLLEAIAIAGQQGTGLFEVRASHRLAEMFAGSTRADDGRRRLEGALGRIPPDSPLVDVRKARQFLSCVSAPCPQDASGL